MGMLERERRRGLPGGQGLLIQPRLQDGLDTLEGKRLQDLRPAAGGFQARGAVLAPEAEEPQTGPVALFGMRTLGHDRRHDGGGGRPDRLRPLDQPRGGPLPVSLMRLGQVRDHGRVPALLGTASVTRHALVLVEALEGRGGHPHIELGMEQRRRHAVVVPLHLDMAVDVHAGLASFRIDVGRGRQRLERRPIHGLEDGPAAPGQLLLKYLVENWPPDWLESRAITGGPTCQRSRRRN
jgi:hypothetical protein